MEYCVNTPLGCVNCLSGRYAVFQTLTLYNCIAAACQGPIGMLDIKGVNSIYGQLALAFTRGLEAGKHHASINFLELIHACIQSDKATS